MFWSSPIGSGSGPKKLLFPGSVRVSAKDYWALQGRDAKNLAPQDSTFYGFKETFEVREFTHNLHSRLVFMTHEASKTS